MIDWNKHGPEMLRVLKHAADICRRAELNNLSDVLDNLIYKVDGTGKPHYFPVRRGRPPGSRGSRVLSQLPRKAKP